ncbi:carboxymuconolactone decarboxylase family protein [Tepidamorphus sp. 3E244]|uniref:carboxymuconolactone decarboxylase family protein n=1 Tax=Tepidamorphus sp. 3E244 TaxID=3385498 RepID=UPI0038FCB97B
MAGDDTFDAGMKVRRKILGDDHVDRAEARTDRLNREFQTLITRYAWGEIWARPGMDHETRRVLVIGTMMALGKWDEFRMHVAAALRDGFSIDTIVEMMLQQAIYCGVPVTNTAYTHLYEVLDMLEGEGISFARGER